MADSNTLSDPPSGLASATGSVGDAVGFLQALRKAVTATSELIKSVSDLLPNETRSIVVEMDNLTSRTLTKIGDNFAHGGFGQSLPKLAIAPFTNDVFTVESDGIATGVSGSCTYRAEGVGDFLVGFDNPFIGSNAVNANASPEVNAQIGALGEKSDGNHNHARFAVVEKTAPIPGGQTGWSACSKCSGMYFSGFPQKGVCPKDKLQHDQTNSFQYVMVFNSRPSGHVQTGWSACSKCLGMHFSGFLQKGVCPKDQQQHEQTNSFEYVQLFNVDPVDHLQLEWRSCRKCQGLFFGPFGGPCPAGGLHDATGSFNYGLRFS
jgi:hypothetical protein